MIVPQIAQIFTDVFSVCICEICGLFLNVKIILWQRLFRNQKHIKIIGVCMEVYNTLGHGFLEVVYKDAMEIEFADRQIFYRREDEHTIKYKGKTLQHKFFADFTFHNNIIVEVKANKDGITDDAIAQTLNYLKASGLRLALIINFGKTTL